jgi:transcriptional regulator with XRE-family HTH domain
MTLGEKIKFARSKKNISQQELSEKAGTHQKNISKYEKDAVVPSATTLKKIADILEVTSDYLLGDENIETIKDLALLKQFKEIDNLPDEDKSALMKVISGFVLSSKTKQAYS